MAHKYGDRVRESSTTTGTGTFALNGAATGGYQAFSAVCANNDTVFYSISDPSGTKWEVGLGTWQTGGNLVRTAGGVLSGSSGAGVLVSFDAGTKDVMLVVPSKSGILGAGGGATVASAAALPLPTGRVFHVSGTTAVTSITATNLEVGTVVTIVFDGALTFTDGNNMKLAGNFYTAAGATITLAFDGTDFYEICRTGGSCVTVASASALPLPTGRAFHVSGTTNITSITSTNLDAGTVITLIFDGVLVFTDGNNLKLAGDFNTAADSTITLAFDGTNFYEIARSAN